MIPAGLTGLTVEEYLPLLGFWTVILLVGVASVRLATRSGLPSLLIYLALGVLIGEAGLGITFDSFDLTQVLGYTALALILAEGGLTTRWHDIWGQVPAATSLSTLGVAVSVAVVGLACRFLLGMSWEVSFLVGAVVASTDAAAVFSVLRSVPLPHRLRGMLEAESGLNDAPVVLLVISLAEATGAATGAGGGPGPAHWLSVAGLAALKLLGGVLLGLLLGRLAAWLMPRAACGSSGLFALGVLSVCLLAWVSGELAQVSGFIATYVCGLVLGNSRLPHLHSVRGFAQAIGWLAQIMLFVLLGLLISPGSLHEVLAPALVVGVILLLVARPLSVFIALLPFGYPVRDQLFLSWAGLRGAVPIVLATVPLTSGAQYTGWLPNMVFVLVVLLTLVQAPTLPWVARRLGLVGEGEEHDQVVELDVDAVPLEELDAQVLLVTVGPDSQLHGTSVMGLRLPDGASVSHLVRAGSSFTPQPQTVLHHGDRLLVVTRASRRKAVEERLAAVSQDGGLAGRVA